MTREEAKEFIAQSVKSDVDMALVADAIKALEQEPFINKPCVSEKVCEHDKNVVLDKLRAEIGELPSYVARFNGGNFAIHIDKQKVLEIIDKYKVESEG